jgi:hypothetical protein
VHSVSIQRVHKGKGKVYPRTGHEGPDGVAEVKLYSFLKLGIEWGGWSTPRPGRFTLGKYLVLIV